MNHSFFNPNTHALLPFLTTILVLLCILLTNITFLFASEIIQFHSLSHSFFKLLIFSPNTHILLPILTTILVSLCILLTSRIHFFRFRNRSISFRESFVLHTYAHIITFLDHNPGVTLHIIDKHNPLFSLQKSFQFHFVNHSFPYIFHCFNSCGIQTLKSFIHPAPIK